MYPAFKFWVNLLVVASTGHSHPGFSCVTGILKSSGRIQDQDCNKDISTLFQRSGSWISHMDITYDITWYHFMFFMQKHLQLHWWHPSHPAKTPSHLCEICSTWSSNSLTLPHLDFATSRLRDFWRCVRKFKGCWWMLMDVDGNDFWIRSVSKISRNKTCKTSPTPLSYHSDKSQKGAGESTTGTGNTLHPQAIQTQHLRTKGWIYMTYIQHSTYTISSTIFNILLHIYIYYYITFYTYHHLSISKKYTVTSFPDEAGDPPCTWKWPIGVAPGPGQWSSHGQGTWHR